MDDLLTDFAAELREDYARLAPILPAWRADPLNASLRDQVFRFVHSAKAGAGFVKMTRIERLASATEKALNDFEKWGFIAGEPQLLQITHCLSRIEAIAVAIEYGAALPNQGEEKLIGALSGAFDHASDKLWHYRGEPTATLRVPVADIAAIIENLDKLLVMLLAVGDVPQPELLQQLRDAFGDHRVALQNLYSVSVSAITQGMHNYVSSLAAECDLKIELIAEPNNCQLERSLVPIVRNMLLHLLRNVVAHAIEPVEERLARGKPATGKVTIVYNKIANQLQIKVVDDGRGARSLAGTHLHDEPPTQAGNMLYYQRPGVTSVREPNELAGCGYGLDIVRSAMVSLGGELNLSSRPGEGFTAVLVIPSYRGQLTPNDSRQ